MQLAYSILLATACYPLWKAWWTNRGTALAHAVGWGWAAWLGWLLAFTLGGDGMVGRYVALALTGCAGVAVLGARRPHVGAWNFVVVSLLAVLLLPLAQSWGQQTISLPYLLFLAGTVAVGWLNYLPTRLFPAVLLFGVGAGVELAKLCGVGMDDRLLGVARLLTALSPWTALVCVARSRDPVSAVDREWLSFRDRFGVVWGQRAREQFNRAAANAHWPLTLTWHGLEAAPDKPAPPEEDVHATLRAVLKRFETQEEADGLS